MPPPPAPVEVQDPRDPRLDAWRDLKARQRPDPARVVAEGEVAVLRLLASPLRVEAVLVTPARLARVLAALEARPDGSSVALLVAPEPLLSEVTGVPFHRGCLACAARPALDALPDLDPRRPATVVVAERVADPVNVGALARNARALGACLLVLDPRGADPFVPRAVRASMGQVFSLPLARLEPARAVAALRARLPGCVVVAATTDPGAVPLPAFARPERVLLLVGNEGEGLSHALRALADVAVTIPIAPGADSLNVAAATAVLLHALGTPRP